MILKSICGLLLKIPVDVRDYYDDVRRDTKGNLVAASAEHEFVKLQEVVVQNAGPYPVGVRQITLDFELGSLSSEDDHDYDLVSQVGTKIICSRIPSLMNVAW